MYSKIIFSFIFLLSCFKISSQNLNKTKREAGHSFNHKKIKCNLNSQIYKEDIKKNIAQLIKDGNYIGQQTQTSKSNITHPMFLWPIRQVDGLNYNKFWGVGAYVDHNEEYPDQLTDYNCGTQTYDDENGDNHKGVDIFPFPFQWKLMEENKVEVIAAYGGQIITKYEGEPDQNCELIPENYNGWNGIYIQHEDGSVANYGHLKNEFMTTKGVGDYVEAGEYLAIIGSSGYSTGPHLHFEVFTNAEQTTLIDPYFGDCNETITESWWIDQKPYRDPKINLISSHSETVDIGDCPESETPNLSNEFNTQDTVYLYAFITDQEPDTEMNLKVLKPDGSVHEEWTKTFTTFYTYSNWYWWFNFEDAGEYTWQVTYGGETLSHSFIVNESAGVDEFIIDKTIVTPNPVNNKLFINSKVKINSAQIIDALGKVIININKKNITSLNTEKLSSGLYFLKVKNKNNKARIIKIIKE